MARKARTNRVKGGTEDTRRSIARWLWDVRRTVRQAGNVIRAVHPGVAYRVATRDGRGLLWVMGSPTGGSVKFTEIAA